MNDLLSQVTSQTKILIWLTKPAQKLNDDFLKSVDYLVDGLFTSKLAQAEFSGSQIFMGKNFGKNLFVLVSDEDPTSAIRQLKTLAASELAPGSEILLKNDSLKDWKTEDWERELSAKLRTL